MSTIPYTMIVYEFPSGHKQPVNLVGTVAIDPVTGLPVGAAGQPVADAQLVGKGDAQYSLSAAVTLAAAATAGTPPLAGVPAGSTAVTIQPVGGDIFMSRDGTDASATHGLKIFDGQTATITSTAAGLAAIRLFATTATPVNLQFKG